MDFLLHSLVSGLIVRGFLGGVGWIFRAFFGTRLKAAVEHEFGVKMAAMQAELRQREEQFKDELRGKAAVIQALQGGALAAQANRQGANDKRRLEAIDQLWGGVSALRPARITPQIWKTFDYKKCLTEAARNSKFREAFVMFGNAGEQSIKDIRGDEARPHVTKLAWAYFVAYRSILAFYVARLIQLQSGVADDFTDHRSVQKVVLAALPHHADMLSNFGVEALYLYLDELEDKLLDEFAVMLAGKEGDVENVKRAAEILEVVKQVERTNSPEVHAVATALEEGECGVSLANAPEAKPAVVQPR
jgi:hypothetical protein